jgi:hypothetical protein
MFVVYLTMMSVSQAQMVGRLMNNKSERMWKEGTSPRGTEQYHEKLHVE